jgi:adenylyltransferase/sulfurtransferase
MILCWSISHPNFVKIFIQFGLPVDSLSSLPILGNAILAAEAPQITVQELKQIIDSKNDKLLLVDVRSPEEYEDSHISGAILVPLTDIENRTGIKKIKSLIPGHRLITYCSTGVRSNKAIELLKQQGIQAKNLTGGIREWRQKIEPSMPEI